MTGDPPTVIPNTIAGVKLLRVSRYHNGEDGVTIEDLPIIAWTCEKSDLPNSDGQLVMIPQTIAPMNTTFSMDFIVHGENYCGVWPDTFHGRSREETVRHALWELEQEEKRRFGEVRDE
jgi:hypothetical protein